MPSYTVYGKTTIEWTVEVQAVNETEARKQAELDWEMWTDTEDTQIDEVVINNE